MSYWLNIRRMAGVAEGHGYSACFTEIAACEHTALDAVTRATAQREAAALVQDWNVRLAALDPAWGRPEIVEWDVDWAAHGDIPEPGSAIADGAQLRCGCSPMSSGGGYTATRRDQGWWIHPHDAPATAGWWVATATTPVAEVAERLATYCGWYCWAAACEADVAAYVG